MDLNDARCSFCHKPASAVNSLIKSPKGYDEVYICTECVRACAAILEGEDAVVLGIPNDTVQ